MRLLGREKQRGWYVAEPAELTHARDDEQGSGKENANNIKS